MNAIEKLRELDKQAKEIAKARAASDRGKGEIVIDLSPISDAIFELAERIDALEKYPPGSRVP